MSENNKSTVLIVDDEAVLLNAIKEVLDLPQEEYEILTAGSYSRAEEIIENKKAGGKYIAFLITDTELGGEKTGLDLAEVYKERFTKGNVIGMSGNTSYEQEYKGQGWTFLPKPVKLGILEQMIKRLC